MKTCSTCKFEKTLDSFYKNKASRDGLCNRCRECDKIYTKSDSKKASRKIRDTKNRAKINEIRKSYVKENRVKFNTYAKKWRDKNRERVREANNRSYNKYKARNNAQQAKRRAKLRASELTKRFAKEIKLIYKNCPKGYHVDHIIPLNGKDVSGLHIPSNLQYLPAIDNLKKGNKTIL